MRRRVRILRRAQRDLSSIQQLSGAAMASAMLDAIERLGLFPKLGPVARDVRLRAQGYRYLSVERYLVFYKQVGADIVVYRVLHERQAYWRVLR